MTLLLMDDLKKTASECGEVRVVVTTSSLHDPEAKGMGGTVRLTHIFPFLPIYVGFLKKKFHAHQQYYLFELYRAY